jgi:ATP-dependent DNA helicase 2 subunit 2
MAGAAPADFLDALTVASDILVRHERGGAFARRVLFVTDLRTPCELDEDFIQGIAAGMRGAAVQLVVAVVGGAADGNGHDDDDDDDESVRATVKANRDMLTRLCASLNTPGAGAGVVAASFLSKVDDASNVLLAAQVKQPKPTTTFRGALELTPWVSLKVWVYKKVSEQKPPPMKKCNEESGDDPDEIKGERTYTSYANPDEPAEIAPEMMIGAGLRTSYMQSTLRA